ncbi:hypothetical protein CYK67_14240 [Clostridium perfringens]|nr:hypothetical protein CYK68_14360 [Clostridium perfringens]PWX10441.1 hypothetical protein CYK67_14240 [Clostridium perfringens]
MIEIKINVDDYNNDSIKTIQGNNNAEVYKIYVLLNKRRLDLTGKTVKMAYLRTGTTEGDVINLNVTNAAEGEITLQITNSISKRDGVYSCQLAIYGTDGFLEHTSTFGLTVEANIFNQIANVIVDNKDLTYIENILAQAKEISGELKTNIPVATNLNGSLENNIISARNINTNLVDITEKSKITATDAVEKKSQLENSIVKAKEFIDGLDGSQNIPQIRLDVTELQNGLKSNQTLEYSGNSISANNTLEGRTENMKIEGRTLLNLVKDGDLKGIINKATNSNSRLQNRNLKYELVPSKTYVGYINVTKYQGNISGGLRIYGNITNSASKIADKIGWNRFTWTIPPSLTEPISNIAIYLETSDFNNNGVVEFDSLMLFEENSQIDGVITYLEGLKSFGESEGNKISLLSNGKNLFDIKETKEATSSTVKFSEYDTIEFKQTAQDRVYLKCFGGFKAKTQYTLSLDIVSSKANVKFWIVYDDGTSTKFINSPVTSELGKTILRIQSDAPSGSEKITTIIKNIQLEEGASKTLYTKPIQYKKIF